MDENGELRPNRGRFAPRKESRDALWSIAREFRGDSAFLAAIFAVLSGRLRVHLGCESRGGMSDENDDFERTIHEI